MPPWTASPSSDPAPDGAPGSPAPTEVPSDEPVGIPEPSPDVIDPGIGIPSGPGREPTGPGTPGRPMDPGVA